MSRPRGRRKLAALTLVLVALAIFWANRVYEAPLPEPVSNAIKVPVPSPSARMAAPALRPHRESQAYDFKPIRAVLLRERLALAGCVMRNQNFGHGELRMTLHWAPQGKLERVALSPDAGEDVRACLAKLSGKWPMKPHASLQPFAYTALLQLRGL